jgi:hypothetical protein
VARTIRAFASQRTRGWGRLARLHERSGKGPTRLMLYLAGATEKARSRRLAMAAVALVTAAVAGVPAATRGDGAAFARFDGWCRCARPRWSGQRWRRRASVASSTRSCRPSTTFVLKPRSVGSPPCSREGAAEAPPLTAFVAERTSAWRRCALPPRTRRRGPTRRPSHARFRTHCGRPRPPGRRARWPSKAVV